MHDKFRKRYKVPEASARVRRQIAVEAGRRLHDAIGPKDDEARASLDWLRDASESDFYAAKRKAAAVLGHRVRPGDLPSDAEVRAEVLDMVRSRSGGPPPPDLNPEPEADAAPAVMADHLDRFAIYKLRLGPLEAVKQNAKYHPEGDALYHSLQLFELAREARPYDEEFLLAALLHDVGKAIDPQDHVAAGVAALRGAVTERTLWLIEHHMDLLPANERKLSPRARAALAGSEFFDDLKLLRDLDNAARVPGAVVGTIDQVLEYLRGLEREDYLAE